MTKLEFFLVSVLSVFSLLFASALAQNVIIDPIRPALQASKPVKNVNAIVYPSEDTNRNRRPTHTRTPVSDSRLCNEHELLYPGDNEGDWVCDCKPGYLHYPLTGFCYEAYTQGPCKRGEILRLVNETMSNVPECVRNECGAGRVAYNGKCFLLNADEGCEDYSQIIGRKVLLVADPTTSGLICADEDFTYECVDSCCVGSKRDYRKICRPETNRNKLRSVK